MAVRKYPVTSRTWKSSSFAAKVVPGELGVRIARCTLHFLKSSTSVGLFFWENMKTNLELIEIFFEAYNRFDLEKCCSLLHPEISVETLTSDKFRIVGIESFKEFYGQAFKKYPNQYAVLKNRMVFEDTIIDEEMLHGRPEYPEGYRGYVIYAFRDGLIDRMWI